jgi:hypothetical protein
VYLSVTAANPETGEDHLFKAGDLVRFKVYEKKNAENVVLQKYKDIREDTNTVDIVLDEKDTKIGEVISKPKDYWYEVELNPFTNPTTIIGYDEDGAKVFKLFPEGDDIEDYEPIQPEDIPIVDDELDMTSHRPVENQAIARAVVKLQAELDETQMEFENYVAATNANVAAVAADVVVERARIDNQVSAATVDGSEVADIRVGADGVTYASAGTAVREQIAFVKDEINGLKEIVDFDIEMGTITTGIEEGHANRARFAQKIRASRAVVTIPKNSVYLYGYVTYGEDGVYDGADHGWNAMDGKPLVVDKGYFKMNFRKVVDGEMTDADFKALESMITVKRHSVLLDIEEIKEQLNDGTPTISTYEVELGSLLDGEKVDFTTRARFTKKVKVGKDTIATVGETTKYLYGYCVYDEYGVYDGVDHGWNSATSKTEVVFEKNGYVMFNFRRTDAGEITEEDLAAFADIVTIVDRTSLTDIATAVKELTEKVSSVPNNADGVSSIGVEYGREKGASYVFVRIPKTTNAGRALRPKLYLTSEDGSIGGGKCSALAFAKRTDSIFTLNAGLFHTGTLQPVGQTIINGVSLVNVPMTDDMGSPISNYECYPLCIDANGDLSAPYSRDVDTAEMIADGVVYAVTGWGKIIDNFAPCADTVENEIVHAGTYIRQVVGQFQNGDYCVCTVDKSRGSVENEAGMTYKDLAQLLVGKGVKFAYSLDGGGSAETVIGARQLNPIYEGTVGRSVPTVITFEY